ncbi:Imm32 family immunity protein [Frateuria flava]|uniref:Imm32 family immunity protein n=1 Tax=Frateuria flava TaxID=2821489 RepID=UPI003CE45D0A
MVVVSGNQEGLVHFARLVLEVASKGFNGAHQHLDRHSVLDECDIPLVIAFKNAPWDPSA